jgi:hypothetical protein
MELICAARGAFAQRVLRLTPRQAGTNSDADVITALFWSPPPAAWLDDRPKKIEAFLFEHPSCQAECRDRLLFVAGVKHPDGDRRNS